MANGSSFSFSTYSCMHEQGTHDNKICAAKLFLLPHHNKMAEQEPLWKFSILGDTLLIHFQSYFWINFLLKRVIIKKKTKKKQICPYRIYQNHCNTCSTLNFIDKVIGKNSSRNNS